MKLNILIAFCLNLAFLSATAQPCTQQVIASYTPGNVCAGKALNLSASTVTGATYTWNGPSGFFSAGQNPIVSPVLLTHTGSYVVTATAGACVYKDTVNIVVNPRPFTPFITTSTPPCKGTNLAFTITSSGAPGITNTIYNPSGLSFPNVLFNLSASHSGVYKAVATASNGCISDTGSYLLQVIDLPAPTLLADTPICRGDTLHLYVMNNTPFVDNYYWNTPSVNPFYTPPVPLHLPNVTVGGFYTVQTSYDGCLSPVSYTLITFSPSIYPTVTAKADGNIQAGYTEIVFTAQVANGGNNPKIQWFKNGAPVTGATNSIYKGVLFTDVLPMDWFYAAVTRDSACGGTVYGDTIQVNHVLDINELAKNSGIALFPNPNTGTFVLATPLVKGAGYFEITNAIGQQVHRGTIQATGRTEIALPETTAGGIYQLTIQAGDSLKHVRFTVNR
jgi:hypothetical protein